MVTVYYSIQSVGKLSLWVVPMHDARDKPLLVAEARRTMTLTTGDLKIVVFVCADVDDAAIEDNIEFIKQCAAGAIPGQMALYSEGTPSQDESPEQPTHH